MGPETQVSIAFIISIVSIGCTLINTIAGDRKRSRDYAEAEHRRQIDIEKNFVKINVKLDDFRDSSQQMMLDNAEKTDQLKRVSEQLILVSEQVKTLFKYKDDHEERIKAIETKVK